MTVEEELIALKGKVAALISILTGKQESRVDGEKLQRFIENYAILEAMTGDKTISAFVEQIGIIQDRFSQVSGRVEGLLGATEVETAKLLETLGGDKNDIALNVANSVQFQLTVTDSYKSLLTHLNKLDITGKIQRMEVTLSEGLGLIRSMKGQEQEIAILLQKIAMNKELIDGMDVVNTQQTTLIEHTEDMLVELERQMENYAFYAEEFDKVYSTATKFIAQFSSMSLEMERITKRDSNLEHILSTTLKTVFDDYIKIQNIINSFNEGLSNFGLETAEKLNGINIYVNEYKAISNAIGTVSERCDTAKANIDNLTTELNDLDCEYVRA